MESNTSHKTKLIVVAHAPLASALLAVVQHVHGSLPAHVFAIDVQADDLPEQIQRLIAALVDGTHALIMTDLIGATPHNCAAQACALQTHSLTISPVSAAMLLRAANYSHLPVQALHDKLLAG